MKDWLSFLHLFLTLHHTHAALFPAELKADKYFTPGTQTAHSSASAGNADESKILESSSARLAQAETNFKSLHSAEEKQAPVHHKEKQHTEKLLAQRVLGNQISPEDFADRNEGNSQHSRGE